MNFKKKLRDFFTLTKRSKGGFTLVELIVVIAILAILAGVAIPVYSGYVKKAEKAGDEQLLAAVNKAFTAAVSAAGHDITLVADVDIAVDDGVVDPDSLTAKYNGAAADYKADFALFYQGNEGSAFKGYSNIEYDPNLHVFKGVEGEGGTDDDAVIESLKQVIGSSNFNGNLDELTGNVGDLIGKLSDHLDKEGMASIAGSGFDEYLTNVLEMDENDKGDTDKMANAAVLYLAHSAADMSDVDVYGAKGTLAMAMANYAETGSLDLNALLPELTANTDSSLASYAMLYAAAKGLALQEKANGNLEAYNALNNANITDSVSVITAVGDVFENVESGRLIEYFEEGAGFDKDMDAYFQTLKAVNGKEDSLKAELDSGNLLTENATVQELLDKLKG